MKEHFRRTLIRILRLFLGLFLYALGIVMTINANLGLGPWDVFHQGLSNRLGITMGQASISMGLLIVAVNYFAGEKLGWGTICNMLFIGMFMDMLMLNYLVPVFDNRILQVLMMFAGMFVIGTASFFYIGAGLGSGPRDGLMVMLTKRTGKSVRFIRNSIEMTVLVAGYFLGGFVGVGTVIIAFGIGYMVQLAFKVFRFDVKSVQHRYIEDDIRFLKEIVRSQAENKKSL